MTNPNLPGVLGFTGTRHGMTNAQIRAVSALVREAEWLHHGDCVGADSNAHDIARTHGVPIVIHPPIDGRLQAWRRGNVRRAPKNYLDRNRDIVDESDWLLAVPAEDSEQEKGGTWYTVRYARLRQKPVVIVWPDGTTDSDEKVTNQ